MNFFTSQLDLALTIRILPLNSELNLGREDVQRGH